VRGASAWGAAHVRGPARLEVAGRRPLVVLDVAHNEAAFAALAEDWSRYWPGTRPVVVIGLLKDKPAARIGRMVARLTDRVVITTPESPRAVAADTLAAAWRPLFRHVLPIAGVTDAARRALQWAGPDGAVLIAGSHFVVGPARRALVAGPRRSRP
jgi:dihydrofolate synthase/folylpolyglutamate synthase